MFESLIQAKFVTDFLLPLALRIAYAIVILVVGWLLTKLIVRMVERYLTRYEIDEILISFVASVTRAALILIVIIAALTMLGINTTSLVALIGAAGLAIGLALQDSLKNFASGVMLILYRPFEVGDYVETSDTQGIVEHITMFTTVLRTPDNREVIVPNGAIYDHTIINHSARSTRRVDMVFGIGYDDDVRKAREIIQGILAADERVLKEPEPVVSVSELANNSVNLAVQPWVRTENYQALKSEMTEQIKLAFDDNGISIRILRWMSI